MPSTFTNPILRGFNPDACILRRANDYYIATSTFEWWPGIEIYHSTDLINWNLIAEPLNRVSQANLSGNYNSGSIWAPHLSFSDGRFWLIYTNVKSTGTFKDTPNYIISSPSITGPWSEPHFVNASGFDPSLFHDADGTHYVINMLFDHRLDEPNFAGVVMQEYDLEHHQLIGQRMKIFEGTQLGVAEGPQMLKKNGWYYLICAAGGTGYSHAATVARSKSLWGPYEVAPNTPLMTTKFSPTNHLQKCGHVSLVEVQNDEWYLTYICARPLQLQRGYCPLGRETGLSRVIWVNDWPELPNGTTVPNQTEPLPSIAKNVIQTLPADETIDFTKAHKLPTSLKTLRGPIDDLLEFDSHGLTIHGNESLTSLHHQALVSRRCTEFDYCVSTTLNFAPTNFQQTAGIVLFYDTDNWRYLFCSCGDNHHRYLQVQSMTGGKSAYLSPRESISRLGNITLTITVNREIETFSYSTARQTGELANDATAYQLSDDFIKENGHLAFTGVMAGICVQDLNDHQSSATFQMFSYSNLKQVEGD